MTVLVLVRNRAAMSLNMLCWSGSIRTDTITWSFRRREDPPAFPTAGSGRRDRSTGWPATRTEAALAALAEATVTGAAKAEGARGDGVARPLRDSKAWLSDAALRVLM
jgi:hypothetical protein